VIDIGFDDAADRCLQADRRGRAGQLDRDAAALLYECCIDTTVAIEIAQCPVREYLGHERGESVRRLRR
jgi:hypothetical protein